MKKESIISTFVHSLVLCFCLLFLGNPLQSDALAARYEKEFDGGVVTVDVTDNIIFSITVTVGSGFFCNVLQFIEQDDNQYIISTDTQGEGYIQVDWIGFDGCGIIDLGQTATGIMNTFPPSFNIEESFRISYNIGSHGLDYFDITPGSSTTTIPLTTTTSSDSSSTTTSSTLTTSVTTTSTERPTLCLIEQLYGEQSQETELLRQVRDNLLITTPEGQELIRLYYQWSFILGGALNEDETFRDDVKTIIDDIIPLLEGSG
jgi:hypothetical protein